MQDTDAGFAYDAVWTLAMALNKTEEYLRETKSRLSIDNFTYANTEVMEYFNRSLEETNFTGVTVSRPGSNVMGKGSVCVAIEPAN